jgi:peptidoglycan/LPS O-acetylase OafA/YrhL
MRLSYRPELNGARGIAILGVMMFHSHPLTDGWLGVEIFFVLSGFLITTLLLGEWNSTGTISLRGFYERRVRRLLPALAVALAGYLVLCLIVDAIHPGFTNLTDDFRSAGFGLAFVTNVTWVWWKTPAVGVSHLWTLSTEEQFYLLWPLTLVVLLRVTSSRRWLAAVPALAALAITAHALDLARHNARWLTIRPDTGTAPLLVGCACACILTEPRVKRLVSAPGMGVLEAMLAVGIVIYLVDGLQIAPGNAHPDLEMLVLLLFAIAVGFILVRMTLVDSSGTAGVLRTPGLVALGRWSYSLYLWHVILVDGTPWLRSGIAELIAVPLAAASYHYIEKPFLRRSPAATSPTTIATSISLSPAPAQPPATA